MKNEKDFKKRISEIAASIVKEEIGPGQSRVQNKPEYNKILYKGIKLNSNLSNDADKIVKMMSQDLGDTAARASITKMDTPSDKGLKGGTIVFKIDFNSKGSFIGAVTTSPTDSKPSTEPLNPTAVDYSKMTKNMSPDQIKAMKKDMDLYKDRTIYKKKFDLKEEASDDYVSRTRTKATFIDPNGYKQDIESVSELKPDTIGAVKKFLSNLFTDAATFENVNEKYEGEKYNLPDTILARINSSVANQQDLALAILDLINEILTNEPTMKGIEDKGNWKTIMSLLKTIGGVAKDADNDGPPEVSAADVQQAKKTNSNISEIYNRIKRN